jgi:transcriptional regulator with GAF, ATPase, and Fis domain
MSMQKIIWLYQGDFPVEIEAFARKTRDYVFEPMLLADGLDYLRSAGAADGVVVNLPVHGWTADMVQDSVRRFAPSVPVIVRDGEAAADDDILLRSLPVPRDEARATAARANLPEEAWRRLLVGESRAMQHVTRLVSLAGPRRCTVLITGESGTGKELAAKALHAASPRKGLSMVALNCSAIPENLIESELFGHVKGAFTGAAAARAGRFEQAHKSTLFLDEIADMPMDLQAKLLRVLQEREFQRLGSSETIEVDVRIIAASNVDLLESVKAGKFREDLYYRLNVVPIRMPPLRERMSDIPLLTSYFLENVCAREGLPSRTLGAGVLERLSAYTWPGNVRQLENAIEMAVVLSGERRTLHPGDFEAAFLSHGSMAIVPNQAHRDGLDKPLCVEETPWGEMGAGFDFEQAVREFERSLIEKAVKAANGNKSSAARILKLKRTTLLSRLKALEEGESEFAAASA